MSYSYTDVRNASKVPHITVVQPLEREYGMRHETVHVFVLLALHTVFSSVEA
jgi:hypothetical protein